MMKKYIDFIEKLESILFGIAIHEFEPRNIYQAFFNVIVIKPCQSFFGLILCLLVISWGLTGYGLILIIGMYGEGKMLLPVLLSIINLIYLLKYIFKKVLKFTDNKF